MVELEILGYIAAVLIGLSLGLVGGGGSILTVPVLVYLFSVTPVLATAYSLFIVGVSSMVGSVINLQRGNVNLKIAGIFAIPSITGVYLTRRYLISAIPEVIYEANEFQVSKDFAIMVFFTIVMLLAAWSMIRGKSKETEGDIKANLNYPLIFFEGLVVGGVTGLVGAGGGFLIVPALVLLVGLDMKAAVGTSLVIITVKSLLGFLGDMASEQHIDWPFLIMITIIAVVGIFIGQWLSKWISGKKLKSGFGYFVLFMAIAILLKELISV